VNRLAWLDLHFYFDAFVLKEFVVSSINKENPIKISASTDSTFKIDQNNKIAFFHVKSSR